ncbi:MAG: thioredoxin family protein [Deltaproteobacteria bacterium]|nr:thioredoxin family protein [Deltaproteobacteria bacterium]
MKRVFKNLLFSFLALGVLSFSLGAQAQVEIGKAAPDFTATNQEGQKVSLSDFKGKYVVLEWSNFECPFVRKHYDSKNMQSLQKKYTDQGVVWLTIFSSAPGKQGYYKQAELKERKSKEGNQATHALMDPTGEIGKKYGAKTTPHLFIINPEGKLAYMGAIDSIKSTDIEDIAKANNYVQEALDALLKGEKVKTTNTVSYGCSVKYQN